MEIEIARIEEKKETINIDFPYYYKIKDIRNYNEITVGKITEDKHITLISYISNNMNMEAVCINVENGFSLGNVPAYLYNTEYKITEEEFYDYVKGYQGIFNTI